MNAAAEARLSALDRAADAHEPDPGMAAGLFAAADLLVGSVNLRNALADPAAGEYARGQLARDVFGTRLEASAAAVLVEAASLKWSSPSGLIAGLNREGVRVLLAHAQVKGRLDRVEEELFRFSRLVVANDALRAALDNRVAQPSLRQQLIRQLLTGKVESETLALAERAVVAGRGVQLEIDQILQLAAAARARAIAVVTVSRELSKAHVDRLRAALVAQLGREVNIQLVIDPEVLGGVRVQVGDEVIEGTVAGRLAAAEQELTK